TRPSLVSAMSLFALTLVRAPFLLPSLREPRAILQFLLALIVAPAAGAIAGLAYIGIRIPARLLGPVGDLATGLVVSWTYVLAMLLPAKYLLGDDTLTTGQDWIFAAAFAGGFGVVGTVLY